MHTPRMHKEFTGGQSLVEYIVLFAIVVMVSVALAQRAPSIFSGYVSTATGAMR
ncbi:MAG: hypothetical protein KJ710_01065 [Candidatus Omnitrophica bacterium]|nr:hypothetical protein [Candidatus Omnitrophota bacterium]MBU1922840.1 hypothetical protein [Candidatus Omnitrophota bacterium]